MSKEELSVQKNNVASVPEQMQHGLVFDKINQGTVAIESSRAIAEAQGKLVIAKRFPRDETEARIRIMNACQRPKLAESAFYSYPRGGETVTGVTIRFAEELARCWGNLDYGIKELSRDHGKSELQAYCWDLEANTISSQNFTNQHAKEVKKNIVELTSLRDIYEINANMGARRLRARILAIIPSDVVSDAIKECKKTLAGKNDTPLIDRVNNMVLCFSKVGVTKEMIEKRLKHTIQSMSQEELVEYRGIYNGLKDGSTKSSDWFEMPKSADELSESLDEEAAKDYEEI